MTTNENTGDRYSRQDWEALIGGPKDRIKPYKPRSNLKPVTEFGLYLFRLVSHFNLRYASLSPSFAQAAVLPGFRETQNVFDYRTGFAVNKGAIYTDNVFLRLMAWKYYTHTWAFPKLFINGRDHIRYCPLICLKDSHKRTEPHSPLFRCVGPNLSAATLHQHKTTVRKEKNQDHLRQERSSLGSSSRAREPTVIAAVTSHRVAMEIIAMS